MVIEHKYNGKTIYTIYAHMRQGSLKVRQGDVVGAGTVLGTMGSTGNSTGQHLHFEIRESSWSPRSSTAKNPANYVSQKNPRPKLAQDNNKSNNISILVNEKNKISKDYVPELESVSGETNKKLYPEAAAAYLKLKKAAKADGVNLWICSAYRSYQTQEKNYGNGSNKMIAAPGASEHQTGLAIDFNAATNWADWIKTYPDAWKWLCKNAHKYGFILRYPKGKEDKTGIPAEAWHWRYIGVEAATKYYNEAPKSKYNGVEYCNYSYEEFLGK